ncbi:glycosyl hydrolase family 11 [Colletotrichum karsti]|uniref:Endo-1,4-beta-xylanase n=1 Tax=Colletotrichum karsti TaxID=1095194 RepID=A0A9P6HY60_9PEZI|nr:glycosyl hydrolase family 11 [Colletotrichum karsti]KAF9872315.1 glycosyl hydrolase family 11 [Colletotrichum karsti]
MVFIRHLLLSFSAVAVCLAAPSASPSIMLPPHFQRRGDSNFFLGPDHPLTLARRNAALETRGMTLEERTDYVQNYKTGGTVNFTPSGDSYTLTFNTTDDFVVGIGWNPGSTDPIKHSGSFSVTKGLATLSVYGWTTDPLVEYYVIEDSAGFTQTGTQKGSLTSDGGSYDIWENVRTNAPSISGTQTFNQYISVRRGGQSSGTVTIANHFDGWKSHGMDLGTLNLQVVAVETWNGAGSAKQTVVTN